jgi:hypothetical protein
MSDERHDPQDARQPGEATTQAASTATGTRTFVEEVQVSGERVVEKVKELVREGNVRRITLKNEKGETLIEIPLTIGVIGTLLLPVWAGIGAIAALVANLTISAEKVAGPADVPATEAPAVEEAPQG